MEQSIIQDGQEKIVIHELTFGGHVQPDIEYIFRGIGDEHPEFGKRDLKVRLLCVSIYPSQPAQIRKNAYFSSHEKVNNESFESYMSGAGYFGYDRTEYVMLNTDMLNHSVVYPMKQFSWGNDRALYQKNITFDPTDLQILLDAKRKIGKDKKQGASGELELFKLCMHKVLLSEDGTAVGDLNLRVVYMP